VRGYYPGKNQRKTGLPGTKDAKDVRQGSSRAEFAGVNSTSAEVVLDISPLVSEYVFIGYGSYISFIK
jgi:hypothetical protein